MDSATILNPFYITGLFIIKTRKDNNNNNKNPEKQKFSDVFTGYSKFSNNVLTFAGFPSSILK